MFRSSPSDYKKQLRIPSVRRERYYGSVEMVVSLDESGKIKNFGRFRLEPGPEANTEDFVPQSPVIVENPQTVTRWYFRYFLGNEHQNFAGIDPHTKNPFFFSVMLEDEADSSRNCRAMLWVASGPRKLCFPYPPQSKQLTAKSILQKVPGMKEYSRSLKEITTPKIQKDLLVLEDQEGSTNCKFGVIYAHSGQLSDIEMLSNEQGSDEFEQFLKLLGQIVELNGWGSYRAGLDTTTGSTGKHSVYTTFSGHEIMFHVSTMLPYSTENKQQIERKRHIGNDIVNIVFEDQGDPRNPTFNPSMMKSQFTHIFGLVTFDPVEKIYRLWVFSEESVPAFGPSLPCPPEFDDSAQFREFLLTKLINGEKAAFRAEVFEQKRRRTNDTLIKDMYMEYLNDCVKESKGLQKMTDSVIKHLRSPKGKELAQETLEFIRIGEFLKLEKMLSGEVPDWYGAEKLSLRRKQPWEPRLLYSEIVRWDVISSDSWEANGLLLATEDSGVIYVDDGLSIPVIEHAVRVQQLSVLENFGIFLARCDKGKDSTLIVFALSDIRLAIQTGTLLHKKQCYNSKLSVAKGCHLYGVSDTNIGIRLNLVACIGKKLVLLRWAFGPLGSIQPGTDITKKFSVMQEITLTDEVLAISVYEDGSQGNVSACVASKHSVAIVQFSTSTMKTVYRPCVPKPNVRSVIASAEGDSEEVLYSFDNTTVIIDSEERTQEIFWTSNLDSIAYRFPFVFAFAYDVIEIRLAINGNLLSSIYMPGVVLLASKKDILFAAEPTPYATHNILGEFRDRGWTNPGCSKTISNVDKRWGIYRIDTKDLSQNAAQKLPRTVMRQKSSPTIGPKGEKQPNVPKEGVTKEINRSNLLDAVAVEVREKSSGSDSGISSHPSFNESPTKEFHSPSHEDPFGDIML